MYLLAELITHLFKLTMHLLMQFSPTFVMRLFRELANILLGKLALCLVGQLEMYLFAKLIAYLLANQLYI